MARWGRRVRPLGGAGSSSRSPNPSAVGWEPQHPLASNTCPAECRRSGTPERYGSWNPSSRSGNDSPRRCRCPGIDQQSGQGRNRWQLLRPGACTPLRRGSRRDQATATRRPPCRRRPPMSNLDLWCTKGLGRPQRRRNEPSDCHRRRRWRGTGKEPELAQVLMGGPHDGSNRPEATSSASRTIRSPRPAPARTPGRNVTAYARGRGHMKLTDARPAPPSTHVRYIYQHIRSKKLMGFSAVARSIWEPTWPHDRYIYLPWRPRRSARPRAGSHRRQRYIYL